MNNRMEDLIAAGASRRKLRDGRQRNATDRTLDPKGSLPEMMEEARAAINSLCTQRRDSLMENMEEERVLIRQQADEGVQREKEKLSAQRTKTEAITEEMVALNDRLAAAIVPLPEPDDADERRRIYIRKMKKAEAKVNALNLMLGKTDAKELYDKTKQMYTDQGTESPSYPCRAGPATTLLISPTLHVSCFVDVQLQQGRRTHFHKTKRRRRKWSVPCWRRPRSKHWRWILPKWMSCEPRAYLRRWSN